LGFPFFFVVVVVVVIVYSVPSRFLTQFVVPSREFGQHRDEAQKQRLSLAVQIGAEHVAQSHHLLDYDYDNDNDNRSPAMRDH